jgi:putative transposase
VTSENETGPETVESSGPRQAEAVDQELVGRAQAEGLQLTGDGGRLQQLAERLLESSLDGEITDHLGHDERRYVFLGTATAAALVIWLRT